ncbi:glutaredoxin family protein [Streptomyces sp. MMS24-I2-30]|uniref:glutaredoxin family protein n=1 Tax=Streptomyces sp. MMS24-I2-30 TaxID=3351564 RepID=UPI003896DA4B
MAGMSTLFRRKPPSPETSAPPGRRGAPGALPVPSGRDGSAARDRRVTLIRKPGCHLCDDAQAVIERVCADLGVPWELRDITEDARLHDQYWEQIPVVLVDGEQHTFWRVNEGRLRAELTG